jgi:hypothetical protein
VRKLLVLFAVLAASGCGSDGFDRRTVQVSGVYEKGVVHTVLDPVMSVGTAQGIYWATTNVCVVHVRLDGKVVQAVRAEEFCYRTSPGTSLTLVRHTVRRRDGRILFEQYD